MASISKPTTVDTRGSRLGTVHRQRIKRLAARHSLAELRTRNSDEPMAAAAAAAEVTGRLGGAVREDPVAAAAAREAPYKGLLQPVEEGGVPLLRPSPAAGASRHHPHHLLRIHRCHEANSFELYVQVGELRAPTSVIEMAGR